MAMSLARYLDSGNYLSLATGSVILALEAWVVLEGIATVRREIRAAAASCVKLLLSSSIRVGFT